MPSKKKVLVIGISGYAGSGKDYLATDLNARLVGVPIYTTHFAQPIKDNVNSMFGWNYDHAYGALKEVVDPLWGFSPRRAYQLFGTEFGRALSKDIWVSFADKTRREIEADTEHPSVLLIPDCRFLNEVDWIAKHGYLVSMVRPAGIAMEVPHHESEAHVEEIAEFHADFKIYNDHGQSYQDGVEALLPYIKLKLEAMKNE